MSPFFMAAIACSAAGPTQSSAKANGRLTMRATSAATGLSESFGSRPCGRLRCDSRMTLPPLPASSAIVWAISSMRVASVTLPPAIGTLRSTRNSTRFPVTSAWSRLRKDCMDAQRLRCENSGELAHRHRGVDHAIGEAPLIIVPRHHPHQRAVDDLGLVDVENARMRVVVEVARHIGRLGEAEDALELLFGGALDRAVDLVLRRGAFGVELDGDHRDVRGGHPDGDAVEPAG